ncbi:MAG: FAD-binding oxidoreductase [Halolamina sp.]
MATTDTPDHDAVQRLQNQVHGAVLHPGDEGYDEARSVWNAMIDRYPSHIVRCQGAADVKAGVDFAREHDLLLAVKGGGHNFAGSAVCDDGLMLDLSPMDSVRVDPQARTARVGPGATWADFDHEAQAFDLATTGGLVSMTGVAGLTLGGGQGYLARKHGLTIDNLVGADVITADGEFVRASEDENEDLFWALRGGGGNFGVVTAFEYDLHPVGPEVLGGPIFHPYEDAAEALRFYREFTADAPRELACYALVVRVPPEEPFPEAYQGKPSVAFAVCYAGPLDEGEEALAPLREFGDPIVDAIQPMPYAALQRSFDDGSPEGFRWYTKSHYLGGLPDGAIDTIVEHTDPFPGPLTQVALEPLGGAIADVDPTATAFAHRDAAYSLGIWPGWAESDDDDEMIAWAREFHEAMEPYATDGVYANYLDKDEADRVRAAYGENYDRLVEVKRKYDPENQFRMNQNIEPTE